jgi:hypothetical protein
VEDQLPYGVLEVWLLQQAGLQIDALQGNTYLQQTTSRYFPEIDLPVVIERVLQGAAERGAGEALRGLRQSLQMG